MQSNGLNQRLGGTEPKCKQTGDGQGGLWLLGRTRGHDPDRPASPPAAYQPVSRLAKLGNAKGQKMRDGREGARVYQRRGGGTRPKAGEVEARGQWQGEANKRE